MSIAGADGPPHLAILTFDFLPVVGGVQTYLYEIARRLGETYRVAVVTPDPGTLPDGVRLKQVLPPGESVLGYWRVLPQLQPQRVLVGHAHPRLLLAAALYDRNGYATLTHGNDYLAAQSRWHSRLFNRLLAASQPLITNSGANAARLASLGIATPEIVYPGTDPNVFTPRASEPPLPPVLLTVARLVPRKGIDTVLQALSILCQAFPDLEYRVVGQGPDRKRLEALARQYEVDQNVRFLGQVPAAKLPDTYRSAHVFVMPTRHEPGAASIEGFGIVYLEASASGLPVVAAPSGGAAEAVRDGETGLLIPPDDPLALADALGRLLRDAELRRRLGQAGRRWVETEMNWDRAAQQLEQLLMRAGSARAGQQSSG